jgi:predicted amidohydrolase YtcJ
VINGAGTAAFFDPCADEPGTSGLLLQSPEALEKAVFDAPPRQILDARCVLTSAGGRIVFESEPRAGDRADGGLPRAPHTPDR